MMTPSFAQAAEPPLRKCWSVGGTMRFLPNTPECTAFACRNGWIDSHSFPHTKAGGGQYGNLNAGTQTILRTLPIQHMVGDLAEFGQQPKKTATESRTVTKTGNDQRAKPGEEMEVIDEIGAGEGI